MASANGFLIPGEVAQGNCYRIFFDKKQVAVVANERAALIYIELQLNRKLPHIVPADFTYQLAYIEGIGF